MARMERAVDERGIPITEPGAIAATYCPDKPCQLCTGTDSTGKPSFEWCQSMDTCAATVDWDRVHGQT